MERSGRESGEPATPRSAIVNRTDTPSYAQGYAPPPINWVDRGRVYEVGQKSCVPVDCYDEVLVIEEFERNKPGAYQLKEGLELVKDVSLTPQGVAKARAGALELEKHAYEIKEYFGN
jgi:hypothetical protein